MAVLIPKIAVAVIDQSTKLRITDITGLYQSTTTPGGYKITGSANPTPNRTDFAGSTATVVFKLKFPNQSSFTSINVKPEVSGTATPNAYYLNYTFLIKELQTLDFSLTGKFPDGKYEYSYELFDGTDLYKVSGIFYNTCLTKCCIDKKLNHYLDVIKCGKCGCEDLKNYFLMNAYLEEGITSAVSQWNFTLADELLAKAQKYCNFKNCGC